MILDGRKVQEKWLELLREDIDESGLPAVLATVMAGNDPASELYVRMKHRACEQVHIGSLGITLPATATTKEVVAKVKVLDRDPEISGILVQLPLPGWMPLRMRLRFFMAGPRFEDILSDKEGVRSTF